MSHIHQCPEATFASSIHNRHFWLCHRPICDSPEVYDCGIVADSKSRQNDFDHTEAARKGQQTRRNRKNHCTSVPSNPGSVIEIFTLEDS